MDIFQTCMTGVARCTTTNWILCLSIWMFVFINCNEGASLKRTASPEFNKENAESSLDKLNMSYDEYPVRKYLYHFDLIR